MRGVPLTPSEVVAIVTRKVHGYEAIGLDREAAVLMAATFYGADLVKLGDLVPPVAVESVA